MKAALQNEQISSKLFNWNTSQFERCEVCLPYTGWAWILVACEMMSEDLVSSSIGWTIYCSVNKPRVPVDRGKLNDRTTAEASQNKVEVARSHSSQSVAFGTFCSDNSIFSLGSKYSANCNESTTTVVLYCAKTNRHTSGHLVSTTVDFGWFWFISIEGGSSFSFLILSIGGTKWIDCRLPTSPSSPGFIVPNISNGGTLKLIVDCHLHMYHLFIRGCFKSFSNAEVSQLLKFDGEFALFTTLASRIIDIVEMRGMFKFNYPDIYYIILTATTTLEQFKPRYIALIKSSNMGKYFYALITERRLGYHGNFTFTLETLPVNELLKKLSLSLPKMRMHACENYYNASMCKICLHIFLFLCDGNQLSSLLRVQVLFVLCAIVLLTLQRALYALQLMQI
ncbi:hypothetical protein T05_15658 [Trichinella murrelli]|uniref:Uncharacterized protein n=1 Tax=Trichinella murrelli TaxID=144512 RepID=A0A0V0U0D7_9BILA|nr:hypothetical protein T05_15658 [Trichinella murrelli]